LFTVVRAFVQAHSVAAACLVGNDGARY